MKLVVYGEEDVEDNVPVRKSVGRLSKAMERRGNPDFRLEVFPNTGHVFVDDEGWIREAFLGLLIDWTNARTH